MTATEMQAHLQDLEIERALALIEGVTEIAALRAELSGPQLG